MRKPLSSETPLSWPGLAGIILLQSVSGTHSIFSAYSASLAKHFSISQTRLNYLMVALETGKVMGWFSSTAAKHLPLWALLFIGSIFKLVGYGVQYLSAINKIHSLSYWQLLLLNVVAGNSSCWVNTYCELITVRSNPTAAITSSYSGLSGKIYTSLVEGIQGKKGTQNPSTYLLLSCIIPTMVGLGVALLYSCPKLIGYGKMDSILLVFLFAFVSGLYSVCESMVPMFKRISPELRAVLLLLVIMLPLSPLSVPLVVTIHRSTLQNWKSQVTRGETSEEAKVRVEGEEAVNSEVGNEHELKELLMSVNFWLYFWVNASGSTLGMVYLNNLGHISESRGRGGASFLLATSSAFGFFGRFLCVILGWYTRERRIVSRPASIMTMMILMPASFFLLISENNLWLYISTGILGACSGALTATTATTTSELFGPNHSLANYNIVLTNIPIGSLLFGYLAALNYNRSGGAKYGVCMGFECHRRTFIIWGSICSVGTILSFVLHLRTQKLYVR